MSKIYNLEDIKNLKFDIQSVFKILEKSISKTIVSHNEDNIDYFIKRITNNLLTFDFNNKDMIYKTKITFSLKPYEIYIYMQFLLIMI